MRSLSFLVVTVLFASFAALDSRAAELNLPDPLTLQNGEKVTAAGTWRDQRRGEILELFRTHVYGRAPVGRPEGLKFELTESAADAMDGKATRKQVKISYSGRGGDGAIQLVLFVRTRPPNRRRACCSSAIVRRPTSIRLAR